MVEVEEQKAFKRKILHRIFGSKEQKAMRLYLERLAHHNYEHHVARRITTMGRRWVHLQHGKRHAAAALAYSWLAFAATLTRRRKRVAAALVAGRAIRCALARRRARRRREDKRWLGEKIWVSRS